MKPEINKVHCPIENWNQLFNQMEKTKNEFNDIRSLNHL